MQKYGNSYAIHIPGDMVGLMPFAPYELIDIKVRGGNVIIKTKRG